MILKILSFVEDRCESCCLCSFGEIESLLIMLIFIYLIKAQELLADYPFCPRLNINTVE